MSVYRPERPEFRRLIEQHNVVPVWREVLTDLHTPVAAFRQLQGTWGADAFLLESVEGGERWARYSFIGGDSFAGVMAKDGVVTVAGAPPILAVEGEPPLAYVKRLLASFDAPTLPGLPPLHGGAVGYVGYDCVRELERIGAGPSDDLGLPDLALLLTRTFVVFDHLKQKAFVIANVTTGAGSADALYDDAIQRCEAVIDRLSSTVPASPVDLSPGDVSAVDTPVDDGEFAAWVEQAKEHVYAGDVFQVVPSRRFEAPLSGSAFDAYRILRTLNPSPYMYFLRIGASDEHDVIEIAGSSPEPMVRVTGDVVVTRPIAGTRGRAIDPEDDERLAHELLSDEKERAEHVMLVDLARNDVGRVARYGSVSVDELMVIERYSHVMHIVSSVSGRLAPDRSGFEAFTACFPAGTVSGAPKVRAMQIIDSFEPTRRGPYAGAVGYFDFSGNLDTCITIRTMVAMGGRAYVQAGAGVVADSVPEEEAAETRRKAEALLAAAAGAGGS